MAEGTKLVLGFETSTGSPITMSFNYAKKEAGISKIKALMAGIITNGSIFKKVPATSVSAKEVTTSENVYDLSA